ncbi:MAG: hypothetical protein A4E64_01575 [Syntrophorhabdus sp. PtaU1.Bin058]|nr:MAG: hypothetical protein A4E64_01575 [Syntrophorhabdus sp. PtaU1.Bin058]
MEPGGMIEGLMDGAIDFHVHPGPDPYHKRRLNVLDLALQAKAMGMRAIVAKNHQFCTANLAALVNEMVPGFLMIGSLCLNRETGGINPDVVEAAIKGGTKVIWMPTSSSTMDSKVKPGIPLLDDKEKLLPAVTTILELIKAHDIVLGTGHVSLKEIYALTAGAKRIGARITITHPMTTGFGCTLTVEQQKELVAMGAVIEHSFVACMPVLGGMNPKLMVDCIKTLGAENCILDTDMGQNANPSPPEAFRSMVGTMLQFGLSGEEMEQLIKVNPARLLGLETER